jgi:hypothetical protein
MNSFGILLLFVVVIYITLLWGNNKFNIDKEKVIVKEVALPTSFYDYFNQQPLTTSYSQMFGIDGDELNLINTTLDLSNSKNNKVFVPQRQFTEL